MALTSCFKGEITARQKRRTQNRDVLSLGGLRAGYKRNRQLSGFQVFQPLVE